MSKIQNFFKKKKNNKIQIPKPSCFNPEKDNPYPLCKGMSNPVEFAENDCIHCNIYKDFGSDYYDN